MNKRNRRLMGILAATAAITGGSASLGESTPLGLSGETVSITEALVDAARSFEKVDVNQDELIDEDEYAAQRIVYAQLARFRRTVTIDGQSVFSIEVPRDVPQRLSASERAALDAVARRDFHMTRMGEPGFDRNMWQESRLAAFRGADRNRDGVLGGRELDAYAKSMAGQLSSFAPPRS